MEPKIQEKAWNPELELEIIKQWEDSRLYQFNPQEKNFTIDTPPPYPSGRPWHIGAASHYSQIDMIARTARMTGKNVYFPIGIDRNGLPVELYTEKKNGIRMRETERGRFLELCREALDDLEAEMIQIMKSLGISGDFSNYYRTDSQEDERYTDLIGKKATVPIFNHEVEIKTHHSAQKEFGSGAVMVCSYGDQNDVALFRELNLDEVVAIGLDGRLTEVSGEYVGLKPKQARQKIIEDLEKKGFVEKIEEIAHRTPVSERSKNPIEIIPMEEYYLKQLDSIEKMKKLGAQIRFYPEMHKQILMNWLESIAIDWPISRRRFYGTEIPIWYCKDCLEPHIPEPGKGNDPAKDRQHKNKSAKHDHPEDNGEERTFDTWMDSSISPLFVTKFGKDEEFFKKTYPTAIRPQAKDIVRTWLYYTLLRCEQLTGKKPWSEAWIIGYGLDEKGMKMSKSIGNALELLPIIQKFGADTFRFWSASEINHGHDFRCNEQKIESTKKFLSKLWNVARSEER